MGVVFYKKEDITGKIFNNLKAVSTGDGKKIYCECACGNFHFVYLYCLVNGRIKSCGCLKNKRIKNKYDLSGEFGKGYTSKGEEFYFDLEDYEKIKEYTWCCKKSCLITTANGKITRFHRFLLNPPVDMVVDHINHNVYDNRKENLRICTQKENLYNLSVSKNNISGITGVNYLKKLNKWRAYIMVERKHIYLGVFLTIEEAKIAREKAEDKYFKEFKNSAH